MLVFIKAFDTHKCIFYQRLNMMRYPKMVNLAKKIHGGHALGV
jgi:hypothetical protein